MEESKKQFNTGVDPEVLRTLRAQLEIKTGSDFWESFPKDPLAFARYVSVTGITAGFCLDYPFGTGLQDTYCGVDSQELIKKIPEWQEDRTKFIKNNPPGLTQAMVLFEPDCLTEEDKAKADFNSKVAGLPKPPIEYYWSQNDGGLYISNRFGIRLFHMFRLWNNKLGYMPGAK